LFVLFTDDVLGCSLQAEFYLWAGPIGPSRTDAPFIIRATLLLQTAKELSFSPSKKAVISLFPPLKKQ
jgi:hypothetical protein